MLGDPAYDLCIVTRGARRPFQNDKGLERLVDAYREAGGAEVTTDQVHVHELALVGGHLREALATPATERRGEPPEEYARRLGGLLRRAQARGPG